MGKEVRGAKGTKPRRQRHRRVSNGEGRVDGITVSAFSTPTPFVALKTRNQGLSKTLRGQKRVVMLAKWTKRATRSMRTTYWYSGGRFAAAGDSTTDSDAPDRRGCRYCSHKRQVVRHLARTNDLVAAIIDY